MLRADWPVRRKGVCGQNHPARACRQTAPAREGEPRHAPVASCQSRALYVKSLDVMHGVLLLCRLTGRSSCTEDWATSTSFISIIILKIKITFTSYWSTAAEEWVIPPSSCLCLKITPHALSPWHSSYLNNKKKTHQWRISFAQILRNISISWWARIFFLTKGAGLACECFTNVSLSILSLFSHWHISWRHAKY